MEERVDRFHLVLFALPAHIHSIVFEQKIRYLSLVLNPPMFRVTQDMPCNADKSLNTYHTINTGYMHGLHLSFIFGTNACHEETVVILQPQNSHNHMFYRSLLYSLAYIELWETAPGCSCARRAVKCFISFL